MTSEGKCGETRSVESSRLHFSMATFLQVTALNDLDKVHANPPSRRRANTSASRETAALPSLPRRSATFSTRHSVILPRYTDTMKPQYTATTLLQRQITLLQS